MKTRHIFVTLAALALAALTLSAGAQEQLRRCPTSIHNISQCPAEGCGVGGDGPLNRMKNRTTPAADPEESSLGQIRQISEPDDWEVGQERSSIAATEEKAVVVRAYLRDARASGSETTNCKLSGQANNDFHLDLVSFKNAVKATAVTAEITPRVRPDGWTIAKLRRLGNQKAYVRVTGWMLLDTQHINSPLTRSTNWEIHPVTKFEVCTTTRPQCIAGNGWVDLEDFEP